MSIVQTNLSTLIGLCENSCFEYCGKSYDVQSPRYQGEKKHFFLFLIASLRKNNISSDCTHCKYVYYIYIEV